MSIFYKAVVKRNKFEVYPNLKFSNFTLWYNLQLTWFLWLWKCDIVLLQFIKQQFSPCTIKKNLCM